MGRQEDEPGSETETDGAELRIQLRTFASNGFGAMVLHRRMQKTRRWCCPVDAFDRRTVVATCESPGQALIYIYNGLSFVLS